MGSNEAPLRGIQLRAWIGRRDLERFPFADEELGEALFALIRTSLKKGMPGPAMFVFREGQVDRFALAPLRGLSARHRHRCLSGMAGQDAVQCVALIGAFRRSGRGALKGQRAAVVFIEWPDNRWWNAWQPIGPDGKLVGHSPSILRALDGAPRPNGVGGWFAAARRSGVQLQVEKRGTPVH